MNTRIDGRSWIRSPSAASAGPARFKRSDEALKLDVKEPSDVVTLPNDRFLVASDLSDSVVILDGARQTKVKLDGLKNGKSGLEAVAFNPGKDQLFVASEERKRVLR